MAFVRKISISPEDNDMQSSAFEETRSTLSTIIYDKNKSQYQDCLPVDNKSRCQECSPVDMFKPLEILWRITGIHFVKRLDDGAIRPKENHSNTFNWSFAYCCTIIFLNVADVIRFTVIFRERGALSTLMVTKLSILAFFTMQSYIVLAYFLFLAKYYYSFIDALQEYHEKYGYAYKCREGRRQAIILACISCVFSIGFIAGTLSPSLLPWVPDNSMFKMQIYPVFPYIEGQIAYVCVITIGVIKCFSLLAVYAINGFYYFTCVCFYKEYKQISKKALSLLQGHADTMADNIEPLRLQHERLTWVLNQASVLLGHYVFALFTAGIPVVCFLVYALIMEDLLQMDIIVLTLFFLSALAQILSITIIGSLVHTQAHRPLGFIYQIDNNKCSSSVFRKITMFAMRLSGPSIGISVYGLFVVERSTILMIFGTILTYTIVVLQFRSEDIISSK